MKIQYLNGGLANQVFQYIFARYVQLSSPNQEPCYLDDSFFFVNQVHNGYELEKVFGIKPLLLSELLDSDVWEMVIENKRNGISVPQTLKNLGFSVSLITETDNYKELNPFDGKVLPIPCNAYHPEILNYSDEITYYHGYWLHPAWLQKYKSILKQELRFPDILSEQNLTYLQKIQSSLSVAVHIRRGDYVTLGWTSSNQFYQEQISQVAHKHPDACFFLFSDDIAWCKENAASLGLTTTIDITYVEGNTSGNNYIDLQLMSQCQLLIAGKSAFAYLARLLNSQIKESHFDT